MEYFDYFESTGTIVYDPRGREGSEHKVSEPWWVLLRCEWDIIEYADYWLKKNGIIVNTKSLYGPHISVVRGENIPNKQLWKKHEGRELKFKYRNQYMHNETYWWVFVDCPELEEIRKELGLKPVPEFPFHLTIGRVYS